jgi:hypothetical protein
MAGARCFRHQRPDDCSHTDRVDRGGCRASSDGLGCRRFGQVARRVCATRDVRPEKTGAKAAPETQICKKTSRPAEGAARSTATIWLFREQHLVSLVAGVLERTASSYRALFSTISERRLVSPCG